MTGLGGAATPLWLAGAAVLAIALAAWHFAALRSRVPAGKALLLATLRGAAIVLVLLLLAGPRAVQRTLNPVRPRIAVAVDVSKSMGLSGGLEGTRLERVRDFLQSGAYRDAAAGFAAEYFSFSESLSPLTPGGLAALRPEGPRTDLPGVLRAAEGAAGTAAVVVFTDGGHGAGAPAAVPSASGVPIVVVGVGAGERTIDAELSPAEAPAIAFAGQPLQIRVLVRAAGLAGRSVPLLLKRGDQVLVSRPVVLPPDGQELTATLEWTPPAPGSYPLTVLLPVQDREQIADNNRAELPVEAVRDKIRVLLVSGSPSWSYRFLRGALKGDPSLDVVSFIILRTASDAVDVPQQDLSLIPFPTQKIFLEELANFDLLIFDNFAFQPYLPQNYLEKAEEFVRNGGGFWMLGGPLSFLGGGYQQGPIARLLPLSLPAAAPSGGHFRDATVQLRLTPAGRNHPFFQGLTEAGGDLPPLRGYNVAGPPRPGAVVLAEAVPAGGGPLPLVVLGRHGRGRVLAVLTDSLWDWSFGEAGRGRGNRAYLAFVRQAVRWSVGDPQLQPLRVEAERPRVAPGEPIRARIRVLGEDFLPAVHAQVSAAARGPGGETRALVALPEAPGVYRIEATAEGEGSWELAAEASARGAVYARAAATVVAAWPPEEFRSPGLDRSGATALLSGRSGAFLELGDHARTAAALGKALAELTSSGPSERAESRPLAETLPVFLALLGLLTAEWVIRRRGGLD